MDIPEEEQRTVKRAIQAALGKCAICGQPLRPESITLLGHHDALWFLAVNCGSCRTQALVAAVVKAESERQAHNGEAMATYQAQPSTAVATSDVTEMRDFLADFDGNFAALFGGMES